MANCIPITVTPNNATAAVQVQVHPAFGITPIQSNQATITPAPLSEQQLEITSGNFTITSTVDAPTSTLVGGIALQTPINLEVGMAASTGAPELLNSFFVTFDNFTITNESSYSVGDCVVFVQGSNAYQSDISHVDTSNLNKGAYNNIYMFYSYSGGNLILLQKGYFDFTLESTNFGAWAVGRTLYVNVLGKLYILPTTVSNHWVKSMGYCIPNTENKKRIWFEPDTTYLKIA